MSPEKIDRFLNFKTYKPTAVEYELIQHVDGQFGPSDYLLEAVLYYDDTTFSQLKKRYKGSAYTPPNKVSTDFKFEWLPIAIKKELHTVPIGYTGHSGVVLTDNPNCTI